MHPQLKRRTDPSADARLSNHGWSLEKLKNGDHGPVNSSCHRICECGIPSSHPCQDIRSDRRIEKGGRGNLRLAFFVADDVLRAPAYEIGEVS